MPEPQVSSKESETARPEGARPFTQFGLGFPQFSLFDPSEKQQGFVVHHPSRKSSPTAAWTDAVTSYVGVYRTVLTFELPIQIQPFDKLIGWYGSYARDSVETGPDLRTDRVREIFETNRDVWLAETSTFSSIADMAMHPAYQQIIGLGPDVLPLIFRDLEKRPAFWFWALAAITRHTPEHEEGDFESARQTWLEWAREQDYL